MIIKIKPSPVADTRTCDWTKVTQEQLWHASRQHITDVARGIDFFVEQLRQAGVDHDADKLSLIDEFYRDFQTGFQSTAWWDKHRRITRHHIDKPDGVPDDVDLMDVIEHIVDCVMAGMARSGKVYPLALPDELLQRAFQNTVALLQGAVVIEPGEPSETS